jgi:starch-binding outer membrane protein, SusD/RagB family
MSYEGNRYFDLKRKGLPIVRDLSDVANIAAIQTLQPSNDKYILPIPQQEMLANPSMQQNKGY